MKKIYFVLFLLILVSTNQAFAHKLINHDDSHRDYESALLIPDHKISWAIYENLGTNEAKYYTFDAKKGDSFYASIVIPKIQGLEFYAPTINFIEPNNDESKFSVEKFLYEGDYPGNEFYEPFGQVTYWERQEINLEIPYDGKYFLVVADEKDQSGKYSLAIGTIEDFSGADFFTILPKAWFDTKIFVNDYFSLLIFFAVLFLIIGLPIFFSVKRRRRST
ncbi:MAG: hypothetical protein ACE5Q9_05800 [Nitrosopumilus sp.]